MIVGVLALQGDFREHIAATNSCGHSAVEIRTAKDLEKIDALILPGGESTTIIQLSELFDLYAPIRTKIAKGRAQSIFKTKGKVASRSAAA